MEETVEGMLRKIRDETLRKCVNKIFEFGKEYFEFDCTHIDAPKENIKRKIFRIADRNNGGYSLITQKILFDTAKDCEAFINETSKMLEEENVIELNLREKFVNERLVSDVAAKIDEFEKLGKKVDFCEVFSQVNQNLHTLYEERQKRIDAIKNIDIEAKPKTNAEKLQRFCKKALLSL